jgi:hypothetical protein
MNSALIAILIGMWPMTLLGVAAIPEAAQNFPIQPTNLLPDSSE